MQSAETKVIKNLFLYIVLFTIFIGIVGTVQTYFHKNINNISSSLDANSEITKLNLYFLKVTKIDGVVVKKYGLVDENDLSSYYITFENEDKTTNTFIKLGNMLYFNKIKLCENVEEFVINVDNSINQSISVSIKILGETYDLQYAIN